eukprot:scaffold257640_cov18-Tisochrysis_lutea.AAC.1
MDMGVLCCRPGGGRSAAALRGHAWYPPPVWAVATLAWVPQACAPQQAQVCHAQQVVLWVRS